MDYTEIDKTSQTSQTSDRGFLLSATGKNIQLPDVHLYGL